MNSSVSAIFRLIACLCLSFFSAKASNSPPADLNTSTVLSILENLPAGETVGDLNATDPDSGAVLTYSLSDGNATFSIDSNGTIRSLSSLDYEQTQQISIRAKVTDEHNASIEKVFTVTVLNMDEGQAPSSGSGTSQDPYLIETLAHLKWLSYTPSKQNKHYLLANDLNASETATWAQGYGFKPIASFSGSFDGRGHEIRGLTVNRPNSGNVGLFGRAWGATISQLRITQASIVGKNNVGGLAGQNVHSSSILNSSFDGSVSGNDLVGGLVGFNAHNSSIRRSSSSGSVQATGQRIGGIAGQNFTGSSITDSYSLSSLTGHRNVGGLVGLASGGTTIERSFSTGAVVGSGGFFGGFAGASFGTISNSFWDLNSSGRTSSHGSGATGKTTSEMKGISIFTGAGWDFNASGGTWTMTGNEDLPILKWETLSNHLPSDLFFQQTSILENMPVGSVAAKLHALDGAYGYAPDRGIGEKVVILENFNLMGTSFLAGETLSVTATGNAGTINGQIIYRPQINRNGIWLPPSGRGVWWEAFHPDVSYSFVEGSGSSDNSLLSIDQSGTIRALVSLDHESTPLLHARVRVSRWNNRSLEKAFIITVRDADEGQAPGSGSGTTQDPYLIETLSHLNWLSHTTSARNKHFALTNDLNASETAGWANGYGFKPIPSFRGSFDGRGHVIRGLTINRPQDNSIGLFASLQNAKVLNLHLSDAWLSGNVSVGMLAGSIANSTIENCSASGKLSGYKTVGGLVGFSSVRSKIRKSKSSGSVTGTNQRIGGLVGHNYTHSEITDCYSSSTVDGPNWTGGLVGLNTISSVISRCYGTGQVNKKGLVGSNHNQGIVSDSFWDIDTSGQATSSGTGATGKSTYQMKSLSTFTGAGWDVKASGGTWKMLQGTTYPLLSWESLPESVPTDIFLHRSSIIENQPAGTLAGKVHALAGNYDYTPGIGIGNQVVIIAHADHMGISFLPGEELQVTGIGSGGSLNGRILYRPQVDKGGIWLHSSGKGTWWEASDRQVIYSLVEGAGSAHNSLFSIDSSGSLRTKVVLDYETTPTLQVRVRVTKGSLGSLEKALAITLHDDPNEEKTQLAGGTQEEGETDAQEKSPSGTNSNNSNDNLSDHLPSRLYQVPVVRTDPVTQGKNDQVSLLGKIMTHGNFQLLDIGFHISRNLEFKTFLRLPAKVNHGTKIFTAYVDESRLESGKLYYFRAYATNAVGENFGSIKKFRAHEQSDDWWAQMPAIGAGWHNSEWFGTFRPYDNGWIYHAKLGWAYAATDGNQGLWLWTEENGWLWTRPGTYPHLWKHRSGNWLYLLGARDGKPVFYDHATGSVR